MSDFSNNSKPTPEQSFQPGALYKKGDFIGQKYEVYGILGKGGFGVVYLVYSHDTHEVYAMKTFKDEYLADEDVRKRFHKEASVWVELGRHPYLVRASFVNEISGRLYIAMEYISPNEEGLNLLEDYLQRQPPDLAQSLRWGVQICHGMEYAYSKGVRAHRDLKPANIMITQDKTAKITDFGLAGVLNESPAMSAAGLGTSGLSGQTMLGTGFGTPAYMPPEQFDNAAGCDERSDIYSFGIVLYQMVTGGQLPFPVPVGADWQAVRRLHRESPVPWLDSPLFPIIQRCLEKSPAKRYQTFGDVRHDLEPLLQHQTGEVITPPQSKELRAWEWTNKGNSLDSLGRHEEAILCYDQALELDPHNAVIWSNKGGSLHSLGRYEEAIRCCDQALELDPGNAGTWSNKGGSLGSLGRHEEAIRCCDQALKLDPGYAVVWTNKGNSLYSLGRYEDAVRCFDKSLELDPRHRAAWNNKGKSLHALGRYEEALGCYDKALALDPRDIDVWTNKGNSLGSLGRHEEAIRCYDQALKLDPGYAVVWTFKGNSLDSLGRYEEAIHCYDKSLELDPLYVNTWYNKGTSLGSLERYEEAIHCHDKALELDPHDVGAWFSKALTEDILGQWQKATVSYQQFLALATAQDAEEIQVAHERLAVAWYNKGVCLGSLGCHEEAIHCYDKALELDPRDAPTWTNKGNSLNSLGRYEEAIHCYDKALELDPHDVIAWTNKGNSLTSLGRYEEALGFFDKALALDPHNVNAWTNKGNSLTSLGRYEDAVHCYDKSLEFDPRDVDAWFGKALAEDVLGKWREAVRSYQQFLALDPSQQYAKQIEHAHKRLPELGK